MFNSKRRKAQTFQDTGYGKKLKKNPQDEKMVT